ncbi:MAG TPA: ABC transporter substrate-binding protein [Candidatus Binatia bacterium]|nr:ABC transporter substrate-binding protein [Candidatus Binatia bacterium]
MKKIELLSILAAVLIVYLGTVARAPQAAKIPQIGFLGATSRAAISARVEAFQQGLRELGYVEGKNILVEYRWADGKIERLPDLAAELVGLKVDIIVTSGPIQTPFVKKATSSIPIVMAFDNDPVGNGFVDSLARPGGNTTGLSTYAPEISQKRLGLLKEIIPRLSRVAVLGNSSEPGDAQMLREARKAATQLKVMLQYLDILSPRDIETAFQNAHKERAEAVLKLTNPIATQHRAQIIKHAEEYRLPAIYDRAEFVEDGGLMSYGVSSTDLFRRAATYVDKILKGFKPAELPVEQPTKFELVINLKAAKQIGMTIPQSVLFRAAKVIK